MADHDDGIRESVGRVLGRPVDNDEDGVASFAALRARDLADIRAVGEKSNVLAIWYVRFRLADDVPLPRAVDFYSSVIHEGRSVEEWLAAG